MFLIVLCVAFITILLLIFQYSKSKYKKLTTITIIMIMIGLICLGYHDVYFAATYKTNINKGVFYALINQQYIFVMGACLLALSIPTSLFCIFSNPKESDDDIDNELL